MEHGGINGPFSEKFAVIYRFSIANYEIIIAAISSSHRDESSLMMCVSLLML